MRSAAVFLPLVTCVAAAAIESNPLHTLPVGELGWSGSVVPGEAPIEVWGESLEDIEAKIKKDHPDFSIYTVEEHASPATSDDPAIIARAALSARQVNKVCDRRFGEVMPYFVDQCVSNLRRVNGNSCKARARTCVRTQCVGGAAVGLCNDQYNQIDVPCTTVANYADYISRNCWSLDTSCKAGKGCEGENWTTFGQVFSQSSWNVIVGVCSLWRSGTEYPVGQH